jgi:hypothetical protein
MVRVFFHCVAHNKVVFLVVGVLMENVMVVNCFASYLPHIRVILTLELSSLSLTFVLL